MDVPILLLKKNLKICQMWALSWKLWWSCCEISVEESYDLKSLPFSYTLTLPHPLKPNLYYLFSEIFLKLLDHWTKSWVSGAAVISMLPAPSHLRGSLFPSAASSPLPVASYVRAGQSGGYVSLKEYVRIVGSRESPRVAWKSSPSVS